MNIQLIINNRDYTDYIMNLNYEIYLSKGFYGYEVQEGTINLIFPSVLNFDYKLDIKKGSELTFVIGNIGVLENIGGVNSDQYHNVFIIDKVETDGDYKQKISFVEKNVYQLDTDYQLDTIFTGTNGDLSSVISTLFNYGSYFEPINTTGFTILGDTKVKYLLTKSNKLGYLNDIAVSHFSIFKFYTDAANNHYISHDTMSNLVTQDNIIDITQDNIVTYQNTPTDNNFDTLEITGTTYIDVNNYTNTYSSTAIPAFGVLFVPFPDDLNVESISNVTIVARDADDDVSSINTSYSTSIGVSKGKPLIVLTSLYSADIYVRSVTLECKGIKRTGSVISTIGDGKNKLSIEANSVQGEIQRVGYILLLKKPHKFTCAFSTPFSIRSGDKINYQKKDGSFVSLVVTKISSSLEQKSFVQTVIGYEGLPIDLPKWDSAIYDQDVWIDISTII